MKDYKNKKAFTCLVKPFAHVCCMLCSRSRNARRSQTKFRSIAAHSYGFTLAETLIVLIVLGVVGMITIPNVIRRYQESQARTKIKKTMGIYDYVIQKVAIENDLKSERALKQWANNDGQCTNSRKLFDIAEGEGCTFMTKDKIYLNISDITHIVVSLKKFEPAGVNLAKRKADNPMDNSTFYFVTTYDPKTGSFRTNDIGYEKSLDENSEDTQRVEDLIDFLTGKKPEVDVCKTGNQKYLVNDDGDRWDTVEETYDSKGKVSKKKTTYSSGYYHEESFDENGNRTSYKYYDPDGNLSSEQRYEYDGNGNKTSQKYYYNGNLNNEYRYEYDGNGNQTSEKYYYNGNLSSEQRYEYDGNGNRTSQKYYYNGNLTNEYRYEYDGNGNKTSLKYYNSNGNLTNEVRYEYDGNGNSTSYKSYDSNGNLSYEYKYEYDGNGNQTSQKYYDSNGNLSSEQRYEYDGNGNRTSLKYYNSNGNLTWEERYEYDGNGNQTSYKYYNSSGNLIDEQRYEYDGNGNKTSEKYYYNGNLSSEYRYEYDSCGRIKKVNDNGTEHSL